MYEYANAQIRRHVHKQTHEHAYVHVCFQYFKRDTFLTSSEDENIGFRRTLSDERTSCF